MVELDLTLSPRLVGPVRALTSRMAGLGGFDEESMDAIKLAVDEALTNVWRHAHAGDPCRRVRLVFSLEPEAFRVEIHDSGPGFDPEAVDKPDPADPKVGGLGLHFIRQVMDQVEYRRLGAEGNVLVLTKRTPRPTAGGAEGAHGSH